MFYDLVQIVSQLILVHSSVHGDVFHQSQWYPIACYTMSLTVHHNIRWKYDLYSIYPSQKVNFSLPLIIQNTFLHIFVGRYRKQSFLIVYLFLCYTTDICIRDVCFIFV